MAAVTLQSTANRAQESVTVLRAGPLYAWLIGSSNLNGARHEEGGFLRPTPQKGKNKSALILHVP
jgi:hypothetical protein